MADNSKTTTHETSVLVPAWHAADAAALGEKAHVAIPDGVALDESYGKLEWKSGSPNAKGGFLGFFRR